MPFHAVRNFSGGAVDVAPPKDVRQFRLANNEAGVAGRAYYYLVDGRITRCTGITGVPAVILAESVPSSATGALARGSYVTPSTVYRVQPSAADGVTRIGVNTSRNANFNEGCLVGRFDVNGDFVDWETAPAGGLIAVVDMLSLATGSWLWVAFRNTLFNA